MGEHLNGKELLPDTSSLLLHSVEKDDHRWVVEASGSDPAACHDCGAASSARHGHLKDLPIWLVANKKFSLCARFANTPYCRLNIHG